MLYRTLGNSGLKTSVLGLGTWTTFGGQITDDLASELMSIAFENGVNFFDTSEVYAGGKAEITLGNILKKKQWRRSSYIIATKIFWGGKAETERGLSRKHIIEGLNSSLLRLQLAYVDIVFANQYDPDTPMEEIVRAFTHVINNGKAFYWGTSRWTSSQIMEAHMIARQHNLIPPTVEQSEYHFFHRENAECNLLDLFHKIGIGTMTWSPLASGLITGKYADGIPQFSRASLKGYSWLRDKIISEDGRRQQARIRELQIVADRINCTMSQLAIAWCIRYEHNSCALIGCSSVEQIYENLKSIQVLPRLTQEICSEIDSILGNSPVQ